MQRATRLEREQLGVSGARARKDDMALGLRFGEVLRQQGVKRGFGRRFALGDTGWTSLGVILRPEGAADAAHRQGVGCVAEGLANSCQRTK